MIKKNSLWSFARIGLILTTSLVSCKDHLESDSSLPSVRLAASESLVIPAQINLPPNGPQGNSRIATYFARGVQKYKAREKQGSNPVTYEWVFVAPQADLYDATNAKVGTHFVGPSWQLAGTNALITGQPYAPPKTTSQDPTSIDWLLLVPKSGSAPTGIFQEVDYIQRIATTGGKAPVTPPASATETVDVPYTAVYRFSTINP